MFAYPLQLHRASAPTGSFRMSRRYQLEFVLLAALWGASFLFMRVAAPEFGPMPLMLLRCLVGAAVLLPIAWVREGGGSWFAWRGTAVAGCCSPASSIPRSRS